MIDIGHASVILAHCDQFGAVFEQWAKILAQDLKDEAIYGNGAEMVAKIIFEAYRDVRPSPRFNGCLTDEMGIGIGSLSHFDANDGRIDYFPFESSRFGDVRSRSPISDHQTDSSGGTRQDSYRYRLVHRWENLSVRREGEEGTSDLSFQTARESIDWSRWTSGS